MRVKRGETSLILAGQVSLVSPWFHPQRVKREMAVYDVYIEQTTTSLLLSLFHPICLAQRLHASMHV